MKRFFLVIVLLSIGGATGAADGPPLPYEHRGACPFECCTYREWTSRYDLDVWRGRSARSPVSFRVRKGEVVEAMTGVVVTRRPGIVEVTKPIKLGDATLPEGAIVYVLHSEGEGSDFLWYEGKTLSAELYAEALSEPAPGRPRRVKSLPVTEWWVNVKNSRGQTGWVLNSPTSGAFDGADACG